MQAHPRVAESHLSTADCWDRAVTSSEAAPVGSIRARIIGGALISVGHRETQPPATAGMIEILAPSATWPCSPPMKRTSSSPT